MKTIRLYVILITDGELDIAEFASERERLTFLADEDALMTDYYNLDVDANGQVTADSAFTGDDAQEQLDSLKETS